MIHLSAATPERFSALATDPADDLTRLHAAIDRGAVDPAHLLVATAPAATPATGRASAARTTETPDDTGRTDRSGTSADVGRVGLYRAGDGTVLTYRWRVRAAGATKNSLRNSPVNTDPDLGIEVVHRSLAGGIAGPPVWAGPGVHSRRRRR